MRKIYMVAVMALAMVGTAAADLVTNGGFETGNFSSWTFTGGGCVGVTGSVAGVGCSPVDTDPGPHSGNYAAYLGPNGQIDTLAQNLATTGGQSYRVSFWLSNTSLNGVTNPNLFQVSWDGVALMTLSNASAFGYQQFFIYTDAADNGSELKFTFRQDPAYYVLDDVSVEQVPEPTSLALLGTGLVTGAGAMRRKFFRA
jgi:hypothetical protein